MSAPNRKIISGTFRANHAPNKPGALTGTVSVQKRPKWRAILYRYCAGPVLDASRQAVLKPKTEVKMTGKALPIVRLLALSMLEKNTPPLRPHEGAFLGQCAVATGPLSEKQARWLNILLERFEMLPLQIEEVTA